MPGKTTRARNMRMARITPEWQKLTDYHYQRRVPAPNSPYEICVNWYPSTRTWVLSSPEPSYNCTYKRSLPSSLEDWFHPRGSYKDAL